MSAVTDKKEPLKLYDLKGSWRLSKRLKMISGFPDTLFAVLNGLRRTIPDTRHTVGAVAVPDGPAIWDGNVAGRAGPGALAATKEITKWNTVPK